MTALLERERSDNAEAINKLRSDNAEAMEK